MNRIPIIGIDQEGLSGLSQSTRELIEQAEILIGNQRTLAVVPLSRAERITIGSDLNHIAERVSRDAGNRRIVVLATGDPLFYGTARFLIDRIGKDHFEVIPHVSMMQLAFARVKESWDEAYLTNLANRSLEEVIDRIRSAERVGLFTTDQISPNVVAKTLLAEGINYFQCFVCENLGARNEVITRGQLQDIARMQFGPLHVMILVRQPNVPDQAKIAAERTIFGNPDDFFRQSRPKRGLLTPTEVRCLAMAQLDLRPDSVMWDIGAGSGSVAIESARLATAGKVYAIEPDPEDCALIRDNAVAFGVTNVHVIAGRAPEAFDGLPMPHSIFLGATGREAMDILPIAYQRLAAGGRLVTNVATIESVSQAITTLRQFTSEIGVLMVNLARGVPQLDTIRFESINPSFLVFVSKPKPSTTG